MRDLSAPPHLQVLAGTSELLPVFGAAIGAAPPTTASTGFTLVLPPPEITSVTPDTAPSTGGTTITVRGNNFGLSAADRPSLSVGSARCVRTTWKSTREIECVLPAGAGRDLPLVAHVDGHSSAPSRARFSYDAPAITSIRPQHGPPGSVVTIVGEGFGAVSAERVVRIGPAACEYGYDSDTQLSCTVPHAIKAGVVAISVDVAGQLSQTPMRFEVVQPSISSVIPLALATVGGEVTPPSPQHTRARAHAHSHSHSRSHSHTHTHTSPPSRGPCASPSLPILCGVMHPRTHARHLTATDAMIHASHTHHHHAARVAVCSGAGWAVAGFYACVPR
jgi:hypothetical protein